VEFVDQVAAVIHGDVGLVIDGGFDVLIIGFSVFGADGEYGNFEIPHQRRRDVVLGAEGVGGAEDQVGAAGLDGTGEVGGFGGDMQAGAHAHSLEGFPFGEFVADLLQDGHVAVGPEDAFFTFVGVFFEVFYMVIHLSSRSCFYHIS